MSCTTSIKKEVPDAHPDSESILVEDGQSSQAAFSPLGDRLLFVSRGRAGHTQAQVYEKNLTTGAEVRITFQNGNTAHPIYHPKENYIVYSSSTDELKENPPLLQASPAPGLLPEVFQGPSEIYRHGLDGLEITRLSQSPGFDGEARFSPDGNTLYWTRARHDKLEVVSLHRNVTRSLPKLGTNPSQYTLSPDGAAKAWIDWDASFGVARLMLQKGKDAPVELTPDQLVAKSDLVFSPDSKWLLWTQGHHLWAADVATLCARPLKFSKAQRRSQPALSPDMKRLVYTLQTKGGSRIGQVGFVPPAGPCASAP